MIICMKLISLAFDLTSQPSLLSYLGYVLHVGSVVLGPWVSFHDHSTSLATPSTHLLVGTLVVCVVGVVVVVAVRGVKVFVVVVVVVRDVVVVVVARSVVVVVAVKDVVVRGVVVVVFARGVVVVRVVETCSYDEIIGEILVIANFLLLLSMWFCCCC